MAHVVLLHGSWLGAWLWDETADRIERHGHTVVAPDFSGHGGMSVHRDEITSLFDSATVAPGAVLVAHSYAGLPATAAAVARPAAIAKIVYLDAYVPRGTQCAFDILPELKSAFEATVTADGYVPPLPLDAFGITDPAMANRIDTRLRPWPLATHTEAAPGVPDSIQTAFLHCAQGRFFDQLAMKLDGDGWSVERLDLAHLAPLTHPAETAAALLRHI